MLCIQVFKKSQHIILLKKYSIINQANWIKANQFAGFMLWSLDLDDFTGNFCGEVSIGANRYSMILTTFAMHEFMINISEQNKYPILKKLNEVLGGPTLLPATTTSSTSKPTTTTLVIISLYIMSKYSIYI